MTFEAKPNLDRLAVAHHTRSLARVADIELGLTGPVAWHFMKRAQRRIEALEEDQELYGLFLHEAEELDALRHLLTSYLEKLAP